MDGWTENLSILQDPIPYRGRCPATAQRQPKNCIKRGKGTSDHMMPLGEWFLTNKLFFQHEQGNDGCGLKNRFFGFQCI